MAGLAELCGVAFAVSRFPGDEIEGSPGAASGAAVPALFLFQEENMILVSHGDLLSVCNTMILGLDAETMNGFEIFGQAAGVSCMLENEDGKRVLKRVSDMSYLLPRPSLTESGLRL